ncbi:tRNA (guanine(10)-N(2))-dimethyltransferase [Candidatus Woesearchaeota archaeon]|jgi:tRNA (guanine26-N2/guanine27-N2)-dimethyltransferase|nr:tRNA (guanine(10)-N(2))-dimethyltransferase [Candidatus Woesearchaeota archaeon]MBT7062812.1 tRNA (guanine(10)-N(2))-dimethyltransferase [Candidatus Woesearchaeota archaeon]
MKSQTIQEGKIQLKVPKGYKLDSKMPVFYNPIQVLNRDISILLLKSIDITERTLRVLDLLAASGARGLRIKKEVKKCDVTLNDYSKEACKLIKYNAKLNKVKVKTECKPANVLLSELNTWDYIDLDPFGTPVPFLDDAIKRISPHGIIGITATDTSALCGAAVKACLRKYGSKPLRNEFMHETAVRILIKKVQEVAAQYDTALTPIFSHSSNHYVRVYFQKANSAKKADEILKHHGYILYCPKCCYRKTSTNLLSESNKCKCNGKLEPIGPVWLGKLWDRALVKKMVQNINTEAEKKGKTITSIQTNKLIREIYEESAIPTVGFYDIHTLAKKNKWKQVPKMQDIFNKTKGTRTHFRLTGIRTKKINV